LVELALQDYYPQGGLDTLTIPFNLGTDKAIDEWPLRVDQLLKRYVWPGGHEYVIVIVTDHTDRDTGDLFLGTDEAGQTHAAEVDQVSRVKHFDSLLTRFIAPRHPPHAVRGCAARLISVHDHVWLNRERQ
jgi:hypothetical protein